MSKSIIESLKGISPQMQPPVQDSFNAYIVRIEKAVNSINLNDAKKGSTKKALETITTALSTLVSVSPTHVKSTHQQIVKILEKSLAPNIEGETRKTIWANTVSVLSSCDLVIPFQQWGSVIEAAFFIKQIPTVAEPKAAQIIEDAIRDQCIAVCNNPSIYLHNSRFSYWMNIFSQFILPIFWQNLRCFDVRKLRISIINNFFTFLNYNLTIPGSVSTLSVNFSPIVNYYTMQLLICAYEAINNLTDFIDLHQSIITYLMTTFKCRFTQYYKPVAEQPDNLPLDKIMQFYVKLPKYPIQIVPCFFESTPEPLTASLISDLSNSQNICPQIFDILVHLYYRLIESQIPQVQNKKIRPSDFALYLLSMKAVLKYINETIPREKLSDVLMKPIFTLKATPITVNYNLSQSLLMMFILIFETPDIDRNKMAMYCQMLMGIASLHEKFARTIQSIINIFSRFVATSLAPFLLQITNVHPQDEMTIKNPVYTAMTKSKSFNSAQFYLKIDAKDWTINRALNFSMIYNTTFGSLFQGQGITAFSEALYSLAPTLKRSRPNIAYIHNSLVPLIMDMYSKVQSEILLHALARLVPDIIFKKAVDNQFAIRWTYLLMDSINSKKPNIIFLALQTAMRCTISPFIFAFSMIESINTHFCYELYEKNPDLSLNYLVSTIYLSKFFKCPNSMQLFYTIFSDKRFKITDHFIQTFFLALFEEAANGTGPFPLEIKKIFIKLFEVLTNQDDCFLYLMSGVPFIASIMEIKDPDLLLEIIPNFHSFILNGNAITSQFLIAMRTMADILINIDYKDALFHPIFKFMLNNFDQREDTIRTDSFSFFLSNYRRSIERCEVPQSANCLIVDDATDMYVIDYQAQKITASSRYSSNQYQVGFDQVAQVEVGNRDQTIGYFLPHPSLSLLFDSLLSFKNDTQYLVNKSAQVVSGFNFINRNQKEKHVISIIYAKPGQKKIEEFITNTMNDVSPSFEEFLTSIGQLVNIQETDFNYSETFKELIKDAYKRSNNGIQEKQALFFENARHEVLFLVTPMLNTPTLETIKKTDVIIVWSEDPTMMFAENKLEAKLLIVLRPLPKGIIHVSTRKSQNERMRPLFLPLFFGSLLIPRPMLGLVLQLTIMLAEPQIKGIKNTDDDVFKNHWKLLSQQQPLFK
ncbi:hypothetical protein TRFO_10473 [Tritrichomonas foetus]|uniref:Rap-GAP domain-containing protein n=1 Tax=Tritrichomonas foetus TaxID=1144522 RepID=A0A1J4JD22_9EUKA|nr:hypothetical protein TRFO_10473 [Tritrichomonas foetus]|eukprot:OHS95571.1 hypothetical protein TRFO_10473 [Tritrichomonas foetus]